MNNYYLIVWKYANMEEKYFEVFTTKKARADYYRENFYKDFVKDFSCLELKECQGYDLTNSVNGVKLDCCQFH